MTPEHAAMAGVYDLRLVILSVVIAVLASYAALDLAGRVTAARGAWRSAWLGGGATAMGIGIWSMHYIGMLAFSLPVPVRYDWPTVLASLLAAIVASVAALFVVSREKMGPAQALGGSLAMGGGIAAMHYIGMAAMRLAAMCEYSMALVTLSVALAISISLVALLLTFRFRGERQSRIRLKAASALVMGAAIPVMHYTGMAAASFFPSAGAPDLSHAVNISSLGIAGVCTVTFMVLSLAVLTSVADRRFSAQALNLESSEQRYRQLVESAQVILWKMDVATHQLSFVNKEGDELLGYTAGQWTTEAGFWLNHAHPDDRSLAQRHCAAAAEENRPQQFEHRMIAADGRVIWLRSSVRLVAGGRQNQELAGVMVDITERKRAEEELRKLSEAVEQSPESIVITDLGAKIEYVNESFVLNTGYSRAEALGQNPRMLSSGKTPTETFQALWQSVTRGEIWRGEFINRRKDGSEYIEAATIAPIRDAGGRTTHYLAVKQDITERKRLDETLRETNRQLQGATAQANDMAARANAANTAKSEFLANMSHEIRTPMNGVMGMAELVLGTELTAEQREYMNMLKACADSLLHVINDILDFSKIEAGKLGLDPIEFSLRDNLEQAVKSLSLSADQKGLELTCEIGPEVPELVVGDAKRLRQIMLNLIGNAVKFTERGEVAVQVGVDSASKEPAVLHFVVRDTGLGIPLEKQKLIFEAFSQADSSTTRKFGGTGLGLTISSRLVALMGGRIWVESGPGQGSQFHFTARFGLPEHAAAPVKPFDRDYLRDLPVLVVDDNATNLRILGGTLARWGMKATLAGNGEEALRMLQQESDRGSPFSLVLSDVNMPEMDGFTLAAQIKHNSKVAGPVIMMLTSGSHPGDRSRSQELGVAEYLTKPVSQTELLGAVLRALGETPERRQKPSPTGFAPVRGEGPKLRVLVAEDNPVNQALAARLLEKRGHHVVLAGNGRDALAALEREAFDVVLMDMQMPEMGGVEATAAIREKEKSTGGHIPVIAMTASALPSDQAKCLAAGMDGYISKPIRAQEFLEAVEAHAARNSSRESADPQLKV